VGWTANVIALLAFCMLIGALALALLWRVVNWEKPKAALLNEDEGLPIGSFAKTIAAHAEDYELDVTFKDAPAFLVFGTSDCKPCGELLHAASRHPATRNLRKVYVSDTGELDLDTDHAMAWESYRYDDEYFARAAWRTPVSPYFYLLDEFGRIAAKGLANRPEHLDRLLKIPPSPVRITTLARMATRRLAS
jgi:hypothetical protein